MINTKKELRKLHAEALVEVIKGDLQLRTKVLGIKVITKRMIKNELVH